jgi:hypothetical protein
MVNFTYMIVSFTQSHANIISYTLESLEMVYINICKLVLLKILCFDGTISNIYHANKIDAKGPKS